MARGAQQREGGAAGQQLREFRDCGTQETSQVPTPARLGRLSRRCPGLHFPRRAPGRGPHPRASGYAVRSSGPFPGAPQGLTCRV